MNDANPTTTETNTIETIEPQKVSRAHALFLAAEAAHDVLWRHLDPDDKALQAASETVTKAYREWRFEVTGRWQ